MSNDYLNNISYLFVPFSPENLSDYSEFRKNITPSNGWEPMQPENRYLHRYVFERFVGQRQGVMDSYHFHIDPDFARTHGLSLGSLYSTAAKKYKDQQKVYFQFKISDVQLFAFNTTVCILAFELHFEDDDPLKIATAQYYLRKIATERVHLVEDGTDAKQESFVDIASCLLADAAKTIPLDFFFYAARNNEKANFLTYVDVPKKENYDEELFFLKWCYHDGFDFSAAAYDSCSETFQQNENTYWGISVSAAVCLVYRDEKSKAFVEKRFQTNFRKQYLMTYILLLHQKYVMYLFLTKMSVGISGKLAELEQYKERLYNFETNYMFSYISEVPQYQNFYQAVRKTFALDQLFKEVQEPLNQLTEIQRQEAEKEQKAYDEKINTALTALSLLTIISTIADALGLMENLDWLVATNVARVIQIVLGVFVLLGGTYTVCRLISLRNKR